MWIGFIVGILIMALGMTFEDMIGVSMIVGGIILFAALIQAFIFYVCPHCGYSLMNVRGSIPEYCPKCGEELKED